MIAGLLYSLPMLVCSFWTVLLLLDVMETHRPQKKMLLMFMVTSTLLYAGHFIFFSHYIQLIPFSDTIYCICNLLVYPLYFLYIDIMTEHPASRRILLISLLPAAVFGAAVGTLYALMNTDETNLFIEDYLYHNRFDGLSGLTMVQAVAHHLAKVVFALQIPPILFFGLRKISRYDAVVEANYADIENKTLRRVKFVLVLFVVLSFLSFIFNLMGRYRFDGSILTLAVPSLLFASLLFMLGYVGYRQNFSMGNIVRDFEGIEAPGEYIHYGSVALQPEGTAADAAPGEDDTSQARNIAQLQKDIVDIVREQQLYLHYDLKVQDLARLLNTNRHYIYQAISQYMGISFAEFINRQRIEHAVRLIKDNPSIGMNNLSMASGFVSLASFYRNFKLYQGCTPKAFAKQILQEREQ